MSVIGKKKNDYELCLFTDTKQTIENQLISMTPNDEWTNDHRIIELDNDNENWICY